MRYRAHAAALVMALLLMSLSRPFPVHAEKPVYIGLDAEFGYKNSTSAEAIRMGMLVAMEEINKAGGVLGGRPLELVERGASV